MKNDSGGKKYILNIEQKAVKIIIFIFSIIIIVVFGAGYFMGKTVSLKNSRIENQSNVLYKITPADTVGLSTVTAQIEKSVPTDKKKDNNQETDKIAAVNKPEIQDDVKTGTDKSKIKESSQSKKNSSKSKSQKKNKEYIIEVYAYKTSKEAETFKDILKSRGCDATVVKSGNMYKVRIGKFSIRRDAVYEARRLENKGIIPHFYIQEENK